METNCSKCGGEMKHIPAGVSKKTGRPYGEFWICNSCNTSRRPEKGFKKAAELPDQLLTDEIIGRLDKANKKLDQIIYLITGVNAETNKEEFAEIMKKAFGKGLLRQ